jgi:hypothetical protein
MDAGPVRVMVVLLVRVILVWFHYSVLPSLLGFQGTSSPVAT